MSWYESSYTPAISPTDPLERRNIPEGLWFKCSSCDAVLYKADLEKNLFVCEHCCFHFRIGARVRIEQLLDTKEQVEIGAHVVPKDMLSFNDGIAYSQRLKNSKKAIHEDDALIVIQGKLEGQPLVIAAFEFSFMGGSMGSVVGERFVLGVEKAIMLKVPFVCITASGGARMQEGVFSLLQMAKTNAVINQLATHGLPFVCILTDPTMGGVSASFAFIADVVIAEPKALIGFAGPRVIESTVREKLPLGFQRSEFLLEKGAIDMICDRRDLRKQLSQILGFFAPENSDALNSTLI